MEKIVIINGPNLNLLGRRETSIYGTQDFESYFIELQESYRKTDFTYYQTNHEGVIIDKLQKYGFVKSCGIILNAAGYTHTSIAIMDCMKAIEAPVVEVHISNIHEREAYRHHSYIAEAADHQVIGKGLEGYREAIEYLLAK
jgi:3-dehydroquinate dehydratase-2